MRLVVLGANGLLGSNAVAAALARGWDCVGSYHSTEPDFGMPLVALDVRDGERFAAVLDDHDPDAVLNCAAATDVDGCETDPEAAHAVNAAAPGALARACEERDVEFAHVSTDYVFDGRTETRYDESATTNPLQEYGASKLAGERAVERAHDDPLVVRLSFVHGTHGATGALVGFPAWVRDRLHEGTTTPLFTDQHVTPSRAGHAAATLLDLLAADADGRFHVASRSCVTPHEFGAALARRLDTTPDLLTESRLSAVDRPAARPVQTCLDVGRIEARLGRAQPALADDLDALAGAL